MRERPPVRAVLEHVAQRAAVALDRQQRRPLVDGDAGVVGLHQRRAVRRAAVELHDVGHAARCRGRSGARGCATRARSMRRSRRRRWRGSASCSGAARRARPLRGTPRRARRSPSSGGRGRKRARYARRSWLCAFGVSGCGDRADRLVRCTTSTVASSRLPCARTTRSARRSVRERHGAAKHAAEHRRIGMPVHAVAAQDEHFTGAQLKMPDIGRIDRPVADHSRWIVGGAPGWWTFTQPPISVVDRKKLRSDVVCLRQSVDATIADPGDQPTRERCSVAAASATVAAPGASVRLAMLRVCRGRRREAPAGRHQHRAYARQRAMQPCDELAARARSHGAAADAIGDDEQGAFGSSGLRQSSFTRAGCRATKLPRRLGAPIRVTTATSLPSDANRAVARSS